MSQITSTRTVRSRFTATVDATLQSDLPSLISGLRPVKTYVPGDSSTLKPPLDDVDTFCVCPEPPAILIVPRIPRLTPGAGPPTSRSFPTARPVVSLPSHAVRLASNTSARTVIRLDMDTGTAWSIRRADRQLGRVRRLHRRAVGPRSSGSVDRSTVNRGALGRRCCPGSCDCCRVWEQRPVGECNDPSRDHTADGGRTLGVASVACDTVLRWRRARHRVPAERRRSSLCVRCAGRRSTGRRQPAQRTSL